MVQLKNHHHSFTVQIRHNVIVIADCKRNDETHLFLARTNHSLISFVLSIIVLYYCGECVNNMVVVRFLQQVWTMPWTKSSTLGSPAWPAESRSEFVPQRGTDLDCCHWFYMKPVYTFLLVGTLLHLYSGEGLHCWGLRHLIDCHSSDEFTIIHNESLVINFLITCLRCSPVFRWKRSCFFLCAVYGQGKHDDYHFVCSFLFFPMMLSTLWNGGNFVWCREWLVPVGQPPGSTPTPPMHGNKRFVSSY